MVDVRTQSVSRLNVLLTEDRSHAPKHWLEQLPRLLEPQGIAAYLARTAQEAINLAQRMQIHAAVIDIDTPLGQRTSMHGSSDSLTGLRLLELLRRLPARPAVVVVHNPAVNRREVDRLLTEALRLGAFSVMMKPVEVEQILQTFRRLLDRQYGGMWPDAGRGQLS